MYNKFIRSSVDPDKLSLTLKGLIPLLVFLGVLKGISVNEIELNGVIETIVVAISAIGTTVSAIVATYGAVRKIMVKFKR